MNNIHGLTLKLLLENPDLEVYSRLKPKYFSSHFLSIFTAISNFYSKHDYLPSEVELKIDNARNSKMMLSLSALSTIELEDSDINILIEALEDEYTQTQTLLKLKKFLEDMPLLSSTEIIDLLSTIPIELDEEVNRSDTISTGKEYSSFKRLDAQNLKFVQLGLSRDWDDYGGAARGELLLLGGRRGAGKSLVCCNLAATQYQLGNIAPYFTIEMSAEEISDRIEAILAHVTLDSIREQTLKGPELLKLAATKALRYIDGFDAFIEHINNENMYEFVPMVEQLNKNSTLVHELIIIDDRNLKISTIDLSLTTLKNKYGDKLVMALVDYLNQVIVDGAREADKLDWKNQTLISTKLKNLSRKIDCLVVSPIQIDDNGVVRMAKAILDATDMATTIEKDANQFNFRLLKTRSLPLEEGYLFKSTIDKSCVSIIADLVVPLDEEEEATEDPSGESQRDID